MYLKPSLHAGVREHTAGPLTDGVGLDQVVEEDVTRRTKLCHGAVAPDALHAEVIGGRIASNDNGASVREAQTKLADRTRC